MSIDALSWAKKQSVGSPGAKLVLLILADVSAADEETGEWLAWPFLKSIAKTSEQSVATIRRHLRTLEARGLIGGSERYHDVTGSRTSNLYLINPPAQNERRSQNQQDPPAQNHQGPTTQNQQGIKEQSVKQSLEQNTCVLMWDMWKRITGLSTLRLTNNRRRRLRAVSAYLEPLATDLDTTVAVLWTCLVESLWDDPWRREQRTRHDPVNVLRSPEQVEAWAEAAVARFRIKDGVERKRLESVEQHQQSDAYDLAISDHAAKLKLWWEGLSSDEQDAVKAERDRILAKDFDGRSGTLSGVRKVVMRRAMSDAAGLPEPIDEKSAA